MLRTYIIEGKIICVTVLFDFHVDTCMTTCVLNIEWDTPKVYVKIPIKQHIAEQWSVWKS